MYNSQLVRSRRRGHALLVSMVAVTLVGCGGGGAPPADPAPSGSQPVLAPDSQRVDLGTPTFSNPTEITNPHFPIAELTQVVQLGNEAGEPLRFEVTPLQETRTIEWDGRQIETRVSQFVGYTDGQIAEVAVDFFAQADDGSVWYFGEEVTNYEKGLVADHDGSWLAGKDGPPGMIMPADPQVGDVYRPENIPGLVFEQVTVKKVDETVTGPLGPVDGAVVIQELLMDGLLEDKTFVPGYGEFSFAVPAHGELVDMALALPTDAASGPLPKNLMVIGEHADLLIDLAASENWNSIDGHIQTLEEAWDGHKVGDVPNVLGEHMTSALADLSAAASDQDVEATQQASIDVARVGLDLQLQFRSPTDVDRDRLVLWERQMEISKDADQIASTKVIIEAIRSRMT